MGFGDGANAEFHSYGWEDTPALTGRRNQGVFNGEIDKCDVFILAMYRRWGQEAPDAEPYSSYTEEEFFRAFQRYEQDEKPEIFVFFKRVEAALEADPDEQLKKVMAFRRQLEETRQVLYHTFHDEKSFIDLVDSQLRLYVKDALPKSDSKRDSVIFPLSALKAIEEAKAFAIEKTKDAKNAHDELQEAIFKIETMQLESAQDAAELAVQGKIEFARQKFAKLITQTSNLRILFLSFEFYQRTGDLEAAFSALNKWMSISGSDEQSPDKASVLGSLGILYYELGEIDQAEVMHQKALAINALLDNKAGMAENYSNLGILNKVSGDLNRAMEMHRKSLTINELLDNPIGIAKNYSNLGVIYKVLGDTDTAEDLYHKALNIEKILGRKEGIASILGNLGNIYLDRADYGSAEHMFLESLKIEEFLGRKNGIASDYGNLGNLYFKKSDFERAIVMYQKSLDINETLGYKEGMMINYKNLCVLYNKIGKIDYANDMQLKYLALENILKRYK